MHRHLQFPEQEPETTCVTLCLRFRDLSAFRGRGTNSQRCWISAPIWTSCAFLLRTPLRSSTRRVGHRVCVRVCLVQILSPSSLDTTVNFQRNFQRGHRKESLRCRCWARAPPASACARDSLEKEREREREREDAQHPSCARVASGRRDEKVSCLERRVFFKNAAFLALASRPLRSGCASRRSRRARESAAPPSRSGKI